MQLNALDEDFIFILLLPHLDQLMQLFKQLQPMEIDALFMQYEGVMKVMRMIEDSAQEMEKGSVEKFW